MKQHFFGFLVKGPKHDEPASKEERDRLQAQHLDYIHSQGEAGNYSLAGPFLDDGRIRGILIINAASENDARSIVNGDPLVKIGRLAVEIHPALLPDTSCVLREFREAREK